MKPNNKYMQMAIDEARAGIIAGDISFPAGKNWANS